MGLVNHDWTIVQPERKWSILMNQKRFALWAIYTSIGAIMMGFDFGIAGTATAIPAFQKVMGIPYPSEPSGYLIPASVQSAWSGVSTGGDVIGVFVSGQLMDRIGRKWTMMVGIILTSIGIGVQIGSEDWKVFLGGRLINAIGFGITLVIGPVWIGETARPEIRGLFLCLTNGSIVFGQFLLAVVAYGTQKIVGKWSYQALIVIQFAFVAGLLFPWLWFPESPYYLLKKNRDEDAVKSLARIQGSSNQNFLTVEMERIREMIAASDELARQASLSGPPLFQAFKGPNLKRTMTALLPSLGQQLIGAAFVLGYITYFLSLLGIADYFTVSVVLYCVMLVSNGIAFPMIEVVGRRPLLVWGLMLLTLIELIMGIMGCVGNAAALWVTLVCIFLWAVVYQLSLGAVGYVLISEVATPPMRSITVSLGAVVQGTAGWVVGFVTPYMINPDAGNLGAKVGFVFAGLSLPMCILFWFYIPETKGISFDILDKLFADKVNPRHFLRESKRYTDDIVEPEAAMTGEEGSKAAATATVAPQSEQGSVEKN